MSNNEGWVHGQIQGAPSGLGVCVYMCGGVWGVENRAASVVPTTSTASASACPLDQVPARHAVSDDEPVLVDPPLGVHGSHRLDGLLVRGPGASPAGVFSAAPDAGRQVAEIPVGRPKPVPAGIATFVSLGGQGASEGRGVTRETRHRRERERKEERAYLRKPPLAVASACAALSRSPRWL